jgi:hypothetical protein
MKRCVLAAMLLAAPAAARDLDFSDRHNLVEHNGILTTFPYGVPGVVHELSADNQRACAPRDRLSLLTIAALILRRLTDAR